MSELKIPEAAFAAGWNACSTGSDRDELLITRVVKAAAPLAVAAELRRLSVLMSCGADDEALSRRADELDPAGAP